MCRFLAAHDRQPFAIAGHLRQLATIARRSREYQGDGWGCAWLSERGWQTYKDIRPIWEDDLAQFGRTRLLLAHARSAFRDQAPDEAHNMPFVAGEEAFVFNGELRGVTLRAEGGTGAEKLFCFLRRFDGDGRGARLSAALETVKKRTRYVRAMNFVLADSRALYVHGFFSEDPEYFTMHEKRAGTLYSVCSEPYPDEPGWRPLPNGTLEVYPLSS